MSPACGGGGDAGCSARSPPASLCTAPPRSPAPALSMPRLGVPCSRRGTRRRRRRRLRPLRLGLLGGEEDGAVLGGWLCAASLKRQRHRALRGGCCCAPTRRPARALPPQQPLPQGHRSPTPWPRSGRERTAAQETSRGLPGGLVGRALGRAWGGEPARLAPARLRSRPGVGPERAPCGMPRSFPQPTQHRLPTGRRAACHVLAPRPHPAACCSACLGNGRAPLSPPPHFPSPVQEG